MILERAGQQPQAQAKQAQITAVLTMEYAHPIILHCTHAQIDNPHIGQARRDQQSRHSLGIAEMTFLDVKPATFLVREEGFDMWAFLVQLYSLVQIAHSRDQIERLLILFLPERQDAERAILQGGHPSWSNRQQFAATWPQIAYVEANPTGRDQNVRGAATDIAPVQFAQIGLQLDTVELAIAQEGHLRILG